MKRALLRGSAVGRVVFSFSAEVPEGSGSVCSEGGKQVLGNGAKVGGKAV